MKKMQKIWLIAAVLLLCAGNSPAQHEGRGNNISFSFLENEMWWGAVSDDGFLMPFDGESAYSHNLLGNNKMNQIQPLLVSNKGRYVWSEVPFEFTIKDKKLTAVSELGDIIYGTAGTTLRDAFLFAGRHFFPPTEKIPDPLLFTHPQYNTWIELTYDQNETDILEYASGIIDNGLPPGVFMIDDTWQLDYGVWDFHPGKFAHPKEMINRLHGMGFKVMLWVCPFVSPDSPEFRALRAQNLFVANRPDLKPAMIEWWNGFSAVLDFTHPDARNWFRRELDALMKTYGVDGFKLDGGDTPFYAGDFISFQKDATPNDHTRAWAEVGLAYPLNEYRACWKLGGHALAQRLHDKHHNWGDLRQLIPNILAQGLMGYAFVCPDMIGGGEYKSFLNLDTIDQELVVRSAQCHALMPMMQFSVAPWRILSAENLQICKDMAALHVQYGKEILQMARNSAKTGEPIVRNLEYMFPHQGYEKINDQFILGEDIMVAPVLQKGARSRNVVIPQGKWRSDRGEVTRGPKTITVDGPLERLPWFRRVE